MKPPAETKEEWRHMNAAVEDYLDAGRTERRCLRCGGELAIEVRGNARRVWCRSENVTLYTLRGI